MFVFQIKFFLSISSVISYQLDTQIKKIFNTYLTFLQEIWVETNRITVYEQKIKIKRSNKFQMIFEIQNI